MTLRSPTTGLNSGNGQGILFTRSLTRSPSGLTALGIATSPVIGRGCIGRMACESNRCPRSISEL